jgi:putative addiction module CopG family antidote
MNISLSPETQKLLDEQLKAGDYRSADEILHAALEALRDAENVELDDELLDSIDEAEDQIERGEGRDWKDVREQIKARLSGT